LKFLKSLPFCKAFAVSPGPYGPRSVSDIIFCYKGQFGAVEIKVGYDKPSKLQAIFIRDVRKAKGTAKACWSLEEVKNVIRDMDKDMIR
jgi:hypothetical protein